MAPQRSRFEIKHSGDGGVLTFCGFLLALQHVYGMVPMRHSAGGVHYAPRGFGFLEAVQDVASHDLLGIEVMQLYLKETQWSQE